MSFSLLAVETRAAAPSSAPPVPLDPYSSTSASGGGSVQPSELHAAAFVVVACEMQASPPQPQDRQVDRTLSIYL